MIIHHWTHLTHPKIPSFPAISDYNGSEQNTEDHNIIKTYPNVSASLLS